MRAEGARAGIKLSNCWAAGGKVILRLVHGRGERKEVCRSISVLLRGGCSDSHPFAQSAAWLVFLSARRPREKWFASQTVMRRKNRRERGADGAGGQITVPPELSKEQVFELALDEYKIIQSKIDNIGEFSQRVRGWSLTITAGIVAAAATKELSAWWALAAIVPTIFFKLADDYQKRIQGVLIRRALRLEREFRGMLPRWAASTHEGLPYLANAIRDESQRESRKRYVWRPFWQGWKDTKKKLGHNTQRLIWRSEYFFYWVQCSFAVLACVGLLILKPAKPSYQSEITTVLRGITNTPVWRGDAQTNFLVIQSAPVITNSISMMILSSNGLATLVVPSVVTNVIFMAAPGPTNYVGVIIHGPLTNFVVFTNGQEPVAIRTNK
jgi:hypothetical protein